tara:strand:+ start:33 stop:503 length:471 start_codon:yes stop_codon:yes gene_type:complete
MNYLKQRKYYKNYVNDILNQSFELMNSLTSECYGESINRNFGITQFGGLRYLKSDTQNLRDNMEVAVFYTITPDYIDNRLQKKLNSVDRLFFVDKRLMSVEHQLCGKEQNYNMRFDENALYYCVEFSKRFVSTDYSIEYQTNKIKRRMDKEEFGYA